MSQANRVETMAAKLAEYARRAGVESAMLERAYELAMQSRLASLRDVFHPDALHPARTALILLEDAGCRDDVVLAAAVFAESEFPGLRADDAVVRAAFGDRVADFAAAVPDPCDADDELLERLVSLPNDVGLIALADRLDHARHLHFREPALWPAFLVQIEEAYLPYSGRISPEIEARLARWAGAFAKRRLNRA